MKSLCINTTILFLITLISGLLLGTVYQITKEPIAYQEALALEKACREVFADADSFEAPEAFSEEDAAKILKQGGYEAAAVDAYQIAKNSEGKILGYVLTVTTKEGYAGDISFSMGIRTDGTLNGVSLLSIAETPGLGMEAEEVLVPQFTGRKEYPFSFTKNGAIYQSQVDAISGATVTTNAMTNGVNAGLYYFYNTLSEGGMKDAE